MASIDISVTGLPDFQHLIELLAEHYEELPSDVQAALATLEDGKAVVWDAEWAVQHVGHGCIVKVNDVETERVSACYPCSRKITVNLQDGMQQTMYVAKLDIYSASGQRVAGW